MRKGKDIDLGPLVGSVRVVYDEGRAADKWWDGWDGGV